MNENFWNTTKKVFENFWETLKINVFAKVDVPPVFFFKCIFLSVAEQACCNPKGKVSKPTPKVNAINQVLCNESASVETDVYEDSSSTSLDDSIDGDGPSYLHRNG